jgi:hypothetical protein
MELKNCFKYIYRREWLSFRNYYLLHAKYNIFKFLIILILLSSGSDNYI